MNAVVRIVVVSIALAWMSGCETINNVKKEFLPDEKKTDYREASEAPTLEVPPDLTSSSIDDGLVVPDIAPATGTARLSDYSRERVNTQTIRTSAVLPKQDNVRVMRDKSTRWLVIQGSPQQVWPRMREFWLQSGLLIKREDPRIGILETDWAENRADIPQDFITRNISKLFDSIYSAATRDKYRVRLEQGSEAGTTELYLTHRGAEEVIDQSTGSSTIWKPRPSDPELEVEMLRRMMVFFGVEEDKARNQFASRQNRIERAVLTQGVDGAASLTVKDDFARAWRRTGLALDRVGFTVEDRDRSRGLYYVRYIDPLKDSNAKKEKGLLDKLTFNIFSGDDDVQDKSTYLVRLQEQDQQTQVVILNDKGESEKSGTALRILTLLHEQLK
ncbi:outer membrane protein assembly factor BamC [Sulfuriflexus sp.]|uniref:outer membrane protein assembly factor BamC n=1 Tax=Sulfuriflexus sp. TaxID=2015443 RepID=UPI0028CCB7BD|nr:outer membrane protein assembly factor BamC [Sulfuriflexus sp.]MDT8403297.1 outer membrane protein assembly factor BamC [Sulfuriflexus sp.]